MCFFRPKIIPKTTRKPVIDKNRVAWVILGTDRGNRNRGPATIKVSYDSTIALDVGRSYK